MNDAHSPAGERRNLAFLFVLMAIGLLGVATMLLAPLERMLPPGIELPRAVLLIQPAFLVIGCSLLGWWAAPKVGLDAPVIGGLTGRGDWLGALRDALPLALAGGVVSAAVLVVYSLGTAGYFVEQSADLELPMVTRVGYGGVAEEILMRWGLMSLLALAALKLRLRRPGALWAGNLAAALIFAVGHLPALYALVDPPAGLVAAVVLGNTSVGLIFGWAFARRGLEAAMIAHACAHLFAIPVLTMLG
jgi:hypothetical protein